GDRGGDLAAAGGGGVEQALLLVARGAVVVQARRPAREISCSRPLSLACAIAASNSATHACPIALARPQRSSSAWRKTASLSARRSTAADTAAGASIGAFCTSPAGRAALAT